MTDAILIVLAAVFFLLWCYERKRHAASVYFLESEVRSLYRDLGEEFPEETASARKGGLD